MREDYLHLRYFRVVVKNIHQEMFLKTTPIINHAGRMSRAKPYSHPEIKYLNLKLFEYFGLCLEHSDLSKKTLY